MTFEADLPVTNDGTQRVDGLFGGRVAGLKSESPRIDERRHRDVESSVRFLRHVLRQTIHRLEHAVRLNVLVAVYA